MKRILTGAIIALAVSLAACGHGMAGEKPHQTISSDQDLYAVCSKDVTEPYFENTRCGMYIQGYLSAHIIDYTNVVSDLGLISVEGNEPVFDQKMASRIKKTVDNFGIAKCDVGTLSLKDMGLSFTNFIKSRQARGDTVPQHSGAFLHIYLKECGNFEALNKLKK